MAKRTERRRVRVGVDTGGTFTDFVYQAEGESRVFKLASTPSDPSLAIMEGLRRIAAETGVELHDIEVIHGTTVGTNALLQRRGARTALVTTEGFEDVLAIGRQARPRLYDLNAVRPEPLVERRLRFGVGERAAATGEVLAELDERALAALIRKLKRAKVEAIAVSLLFSFVYPEHERRIERALASLGVPLSVSHRILPEYREYERTSTVVINAYLQPLMGAYSKRLSAHAPRLRVMQSSGGSVSAAVAAAEPIRTILSGPAGGVVGALAAARNVEDAPDIITFDMGGTSTDVALCAAGAVRLTNEATVATLPVAVPVMDIHTVGAGGGSIARVDVGGSLRVGPESAGASPGPACYGRGKLPTVTDANLLLGRFGGASLLGGDFRLDARGAAEVFEELAREISAAGGRAVSAREAAEGVVRVVNAGMERALRAVSVERGHDPRRFTLLSFGGAGGLHAVELARALRIPRVVVPRSPGALSALGALSSDVVKDLSRTVMLETKDSHSDSLLERAFRQMEREARAALRREGFQETQQRIERTVAARYKGQSFELEIGWAAGRGFNGEFDGEDGVKTSGRTRLAALVDSFHDAHRQRYGYAEEASAVEIVSARVRAVGVVEKLKAERPSRVRRDAGAVAASRRAKVYLTDGRSRVIGVYARDALEAGARLRSPCIVSEYSSTTLVPAGARAHIDRHGNLIIEP
ncbi:MAG TPA: hydantoinase/oxoprolinase family protein [Pyrinomonadaceae bacterium]